ncbi:insulin receptor [Scaptodrosophila lebanonensis]|uniref:Insulin receptor n=1 Tax=Drosophila lebanonensis TaxID=7225 RepID=A0A6J2TFD9_DROLE|nr:insulin receptor [Scaptodrosophila lebanonensis]
MCQKMNRLGQQLLLLLLLLLLFFLVLVPSARAAVCGSMDLQRPEDFAKLRNCSFVEGHVRIANIEVPANGNLTELRSELLEIRDYLMIYRLNGLLTLQSLFPRLRLIRGESLLFDQYALAIYQNRNLRELGFVQLRRIQRGDIRIESNPRLCFVETVDWVYLLANTTQQHYSIKHNISPNLCPVCDGLSADYGYRQNTTQSCWNLNSSQLRYTPPRTSDCPTECGLTGCDVAGKCCNSNCLTGCSAENCKLCANLYHNGSCVDQCVDSYRYRSECVSFKECRDLGNIPLARGNRCLKECPNKEPPKQGINGTLHCEMACRGTFYVRRASDLWPLQDCIAINGSLIIELVDIKEKIIPVLEQTLSDIKEITGYLKIQRSAQLLSLTFFKNLDTIRGDVLIQNKYAFYVVDNHHLEHIWPSNRQVAIQKGSIFFHLNPRLCYEKILKLEPMLKGAQKISIADVSPNSNGERIICGKAVRTLEATIEDLNSTAVRIAVSLMSWEDIETLIGYSYHYMESPHRNVTRFDGRHGCGHDNWLMDVSPTKNRRHVITGLRPYTQYAFFVKTLTRTDYHMQIDAYSDILYFRTLPSKPSPVAHLYCTSQLSTKVLLNWWPPRRPNGAISKYMISSVWLNVSKAEANSKNYFSFKPAKYSECLCNDLEPYNSGPQPEDENYYNKEQITYEDALPNLIYVSRNSNNSKNEKFHKVKDFADLIADPKVSLNDSVNDVSTTTPAPLSKNDTTGERNQTSEEQSESQLEAKAAQQYELYRLQVEQRVRLAQDTGIEDFVISKPAPPCADVHASVSQQLEGKCVVAEELEGIEVSGSQHYYWLEGLKPEQVYRISIRACVKDVVNGCSKPFEIRTQTTSRTVEEFVQGY